jgi:hypothetical protein
VLGLRKLELLTKASLTEAVSDLEHAGMVPGAATPS